MQFNTHTDNQDLYSDARFWCGIANTDTTTFPLIDFTRAANFGVDRAHALIIKSDGRWPYDDFNNAATTTLDVTINLVSGTQKYAIPVTWLKIEKVRIKDSAGNWVSLDQVDRKKQTDSELTATSGMPSGYFLLGNWIYLDKAPNYSSTGGMEVQHQRGPSYFSISDTTKTPGFATNFHQLISLYAALSYCDINDLNKRAAKIRFEIARLESELIAHYSQRSADEIPSLSLVREDYGEIGLV